jgi:hypothetical protein
MSISKEKISKEFQSHFSIEGLFKENPTNKFDEEYNKKYKETWDALSKKWLEDLISQDLTISLPKTRISALSGLKGWLDKRDENNPSPLENAYVDFLSSYITFTEQYVSFEVRTI